MSATPRTDEASFFLTDDFPVKYSSTEVMPSRVGRELERELAHEMNVRKNLQHVIVSQWGVDLIGNCIKQIREAEESIGPLGPINDYALAQILSSTIVLPAELKLKEATSNHP